MPPSHLTSCLCPLDPTVSSLDLNDVIQLGGTRSEQQICQVSGFLLQKVLPCTVSLELWQRAPSQAVNPSQEGAGGGDAGSVNDTVVP